MAFELVVANGTREAVGGPITRLSGKFTDIPQAARGVTLMITDCKVIHRIKRLDLGQHRDAAFSLLGTDLAAAALGLDPKRDWTVWGEITGNPPVRSTGVMFPAREKGHDDGGHEIMGLKREIIDSLVAEIEDSRTIVTAAEDELSHLEGLGGADVDELRREIKEKIETAKKTREDLEKEAVERKRQFERDFGTPYKEPETRPAMPGPSLPGAP